MNELTDGVSWMGVFVGFAVSFILGWVWYSPKVFGKKWADGVGISLDADCKMPVGAMILQALGTFGTAAGKYAQKSNGAMPIETGYLIVIGVVILVCQGIF